MKQQAKETTVPTRLRQAAKKELVNRHASSPAHLPLTEADVRRQFHELQVNQIELEMQNTELTELQHARREIEEGLARYIDLYDFAPIGYFTIDRTGRLHEVNLTGAKLLAVERADLTNHCMGDFISKESRTAFIIFLAKVFASKTKESCELNILRVGQPPFPAYIEGNIDGSGKTCRIVLKDITDRKQAEDELNKARSELEMKVFERTAELEKVNLQLRAEIEERKRADQVLKQTQRMLRHLVSHQENIKEDERKRIAREIHDELGQNLMAMRIDVSMLEARTHGTHPRLHSKVLRALGHIDTTIKSVRGIINNLRPAVLDLGLIAALEWQIDEFERRSGIACTLTIEGPELTLAIDENCATACFRIVQESLSNVTRHARASHVDIVLYRDDCHLTLKIADNGIGIHPNCRRKANSYGLVGIQERIHSMGGELTIGSNEEQKGTVLTIMLPLASAAAKQPAADIQEYR
jgi:signal transduction histidine kinase